MSDTPNQEGEAKFESLAAALAPYFGKPSGQIPKDLRLRITRDLLLAPLWDTLSEDQQRSASAQWDWQNDPVFENERRRIWGLTVQLHEMKASDPGNDPLRIEAKRLRIAELESELSRGAASDTATPSPARSRTKAAKKASAQPAPAVVRTPQASEVVGRPRRRGPRPIVLNKTMDAMNAEISTGMLTIAGLKDMKEEAMKARWGASRKTCRAARDQIIAKLGQTGTRDK